MFLDNAEFEGALAYLASFKEFGTHANGPRLALQALEVVMVRIQHGKSVDDFLTGEHTPTTIPAVKAALEAYRGSKPKKQVLQDLKSFKARFCGFLEERGLPMEIIRQTGIRDALRKEKRGARRKKKRRQ